MSDLSSKILSRVTCVQCMVGTALVLYLGKSAWTWYSSRNAKECDRCCNPSCPCDPCECGSKATTDQRGGPKATTTQPTVERGCCTETPCCDTDQTTACCVEGKACCETKECCGPVTQVDETDL